MNKRLPKFGWARKSVWLFKRIIFDALFATKVQRRLSNSIAGFGAGGFAGFGAGEAQVRQVTYQMVCDRLDHSGTNTFDLRLMGAQKIVKTSSPEERRNRRKA